MENRSQYTCRDYRQEMVLLGLIRRLKEEDLSEEQRHALSKEIKKLESAMHMD